jgi:uncharacterized protein
MRRTEAGWALLAALVALVAACATARRADAPPPPLPVQPIALASASAAPQSVVGLYKRACEGGSGLGCNNLGLVYLEGRSGARRDAARSLTFFQRACDLGTAGGCGNLGYLLHEGTEVPRDDVRAIGLLTRACDASWWDACYWLADIYFGGEHEDLPNAYAVVERACKTGNHERSCATQGIMLQLGSGVVKDPRHAKSLLGRACEAGVAFACTSLGTLLMEGSPSDIERARERYARGCTDDHPGGCYVYGMQCASGVFGDHCATDALLRHACEKRHADACAALADWMEKQSGGK